MFKILSNSVNSKESWKFSMQKFPTIFNIRTNITGNIIRYGKLKPLDFMKDPRTNKMFSYTIEERQRLGIHGLLPPVVRTVDEELLAVTKILKEYNTNLNRFIYLNQILECSEKLFFKLVDQNLRFCAPIIGPPTVDIVCKTLGVIWTRPKGLFITFYDKGHCYDILANWPEQNVQCICVTDGANVSSGIGDIGAQAMGVALSKILFYTIFGKIPPHKCLPIMLDLGTNNEALLEDPLYVGIRRKRVSDEEHEEFVEEFMQAVVKKFGRETMIHFEDFSSRHAVKYLDKYREQYCILNGDSQGVGALTLAGILAAQKITQTQLMENIYLIIGYGSNTIGTANMLVHAIMNEGVRAVEAREKVWIMDKEGILTSDRPNLVRWQKKYEKPVRFKTNDLLQAIKLIKPTVLIGFSKKAGIFTPEVISAMYQNCTHPIIFPLSNPSENAECTAEAAFKYTEGNCIFATGAYSSITRIETDANSPDYLKGREWNQLSANFFVPAIALANIASGSHKISRFMLYIAAQVMASHVSDKELEKGLVFPAIERLPEVAVNIAAKVAAEAYREGWATVHPEPQNKKQYIHEIQYNYTFEPSLLESWKYKEINYKKSRYAYR